MSAPAAATACSTRKSRFTPTACPSARRNDVGGRGWFGTVQVGCDYQVGSNIVIGAFGDYDFSGIKGDWSTAQLPRRSIGEEKLKNSWAAGGRIGWAPVPDQLLVFVSGGYTAGAVRRLNFFSASMVRRPASSIGKHTYSGWFVGTGYEYGLGFLPGLFWKTEYRFADYGTEHVQIFVTASRSPAGLSTQSKYVHTVRSELVWRFNFGGPVVARY